MKLFRNNVTKIVLSLCLAVLMSSSMIPVTTFASAPEEVDIVEKQSISNAASNEEIMPLATGYGSLIYPTNKTVTIYSGNVSRVKYKGTYGLFGSSGVVVLRFTNRETGDFKSKTFICDGEYYEADLNYTLPAGTYDVTCPGNTVTNLWQLSISFV